LVLNWDALAATAAILLVVGGVVRFTMKGVLSEFKEDLRKDFLSREWGSSVEARLSRIEDNDKYSG
jgi:hypothetical protein